jgi:capsular polysaccharide biosynthesis protein
MHFRQLLSWHGGKRVRDTSVAAYVDSRGLRDALRSCRIPGDERSLRVLRLAEGWLYRGLCLPITRDRRTLLELHRVYAPDKYSPVYSAEFAKALDAVTADTLEHVLVLACSRQNYWHFLMDFLPRLFFIGGIPELEGCALTVDATATVKEHAIVRSVAARAGIANPRLVPVDADIVPLRDAWCPEHIDRFAAVAIWDRVLYPRAERADRGIERLFVMRNAAYRRLVNQDEIEEKLARLGFTCLDPGTLPFEEQVAVFSSARVIVGVHGAALTNVLFAPRGATFVELYTTVAQAFYGELAAAKGMRHVTVAGEPADVARNQHDDFRIDAGALLERLKDLGVS